MTSLTTLLRRHYALYYVTTNPCTMSSLKLSIKPTRIITAQTLLLWRYFWEKKKKTFWSNNQARRLTMHKFLYHYIKYAMTCKNYFFVDVYINIWCTYNLYILTFANDGPDKKAVLCWRCNALGIRSFIISRLSLCKPYTVGQVTSRSG